MKLAVFTDEVSQDLETAVKFAVQFSLDGVELRSVWDKSVHALTEDEGIILGLENESSTYCATAAETKRFVTEVDSPALKVVWDACNELYAPEGITPYPDAYQVVEPWIAHVHVKDAYKDPGTGEARISPVGDGEVDWESQLRELLDKKYDGYASLETHWRPQALPEEVLNQPGGAGFSEAGQYASDLCMRNLMGILARARRPAG